MALGRSFQSEHAKFISTESSNDVRVTESLLQGVGGFDQREVPFLMSEGIVYFLKIVDIGEEKKEPLSFPPHEPNLLRCQGQKSTAIVQTRQVVGKSQRPKFPIQNGLLDGAQYRALQCIADGMGFRGVPFERLQDLIDDQHDAIF